MIQYFNDVLCPWCWGEEKVLRALEYTFPDLPLEYKMGALIENYEEFLPPNFRRHNSVEMGNKILYDMYRAAATVTQSPYYEEIPHLFTEEKKSSFPLNKFAVAVRMISEEKVGAYLRKLREMSIYDDRQIYSLEVQQEILRQLDMDWEEFSAQLSFAEEVFLEDRMRAFDYRIKTYPAFVWEEKGRRKLLKGYRSYEEVCAFIHQTEGLLPMKVEQSREEVERFLSRYEHVLEEEAKILFDENLLEELKREGVLSQQQVCGGRLLQWTEKN